MKVTSASRTEESLQTTAAAVTVVTNEDIRRSGANSIPEALRMVPGLFVGQRNSNSWAVSSRGFTSVNSEKLLVLSDTRSIYTPLFSGVTWDTQNYLMEDIDRIEVIRGPGAAMWGSNAVNGVISITTKAAKDTQGLYLEGGGGSEDKVVTAARYGGKVGEDFYYRIFGRYFDRDDTFHNDSEQSDDWQMGHVGFRSDWYASAKDTVTVQGDGYLGDVGQLTPAVTIIGRPGPQGDLDVDVKGGNILGRWQRQLEADSEIELRAYYDRTDRDDPSFNDTLDTTDLDFQHKFNLTPQQQILWGVNYRHTVNENEGKGIFAVEPQDSEDDLFSTFLQDQITVFETVHVTLGSKLEHNDFSGVEVQPSARVAWEVSPQHTLWSAVSRAVRVPTRLERDVAIDVADPASDPLPQLLGNRDFDSEEVLAYELGHRWQVLDSLALDLATFYNDYGGLSSLEFGEPFIDPQNGQTIIPIVNENFTNGHAQGIEALVSYSPLPSWRLTGIYSYLNLSLNPEGDDLNRGAWHDGSTPRHQFGVQSFIDLPGGFQLDMQFRRITEIERSPEIVDGASIDGYSELNVRVGYHLSEDIELSVLGQNLLHAQHTEVGAPESRGEIERAVFGQIKYRF